MQNNINRTFLFLVMLIGSAMFCMAQNIGNMSIFTFNGGMQNEGNDNGRFSLITEDAEERAWQGKEIPLERQSSYYSYSSSFGLNIAVMLGYDYNLMEYDDFDIKNLILGLELELRLFNFLGVQTGFEVLPCIDYAFSEPILTNTIIQIPVLAKFNLSIFDIWDISVYGGIGINLLSINNKDNVNFSIRSFSKFSYIFGGKWAVVIDNINVFIGFQFNCDISDTVYRYMGNRFNYISERSFLYAGVGWYIPF
ncbi:hypothetical protein R84B8_03221 [Treponema sp. R8-4-B8]